MRFRKTETQFARVSFAEACPTIRYVLETEISEEKQFRRVLIVSFSGEYRMGGAGNPDAAYMTGILWAAREVFSPAGIVIDLSDLKYEWGDMIESALELTLPIPVAVVIGPKCRVALTTLLVGSKQGADITDLENFFDSRREAIRYVKKKGR